MSSDQDTFRKLLAGRNKVLYIEIKRVSVTKFESSTYIFQMDTGYDGSPIMMYVAKEVRAGSLDVQSDLVQQLCQHEMRMDHIIRSGHKADKSRQLTILSLMYPLERVLTCLQATYASLGRR
jgi:hypothetical protein